MRRLLFVLVVVAGLVAAPTVASAAGSGCVSTASATYRHTFSGPGGTASVTAVKPLCAGQTQSFSLVSYTATSSAFTFPQFVYDVTTGTIDARHRTVRMAVAVPGCFTQVDLISGTGVLNEVLNDDTHYGDLKLGSPAGAGSRSSGPAGGYNGGNDTCTTSPTVTWSSSCDGAFRATLANAAGANVDAVFVYAGRRLHVAPGSSTVVTGPRKGTMSVRDDTFTTHVSTWKSPDSGCAAPAPVRTTTRPRPPATTKPTVAPTTTAATTTPAAPTPAETLDPSPANGGLPIASMPAPTATALPTTGPGLGSMLFIGAGVLLIGLGLLVLLRVLRSFRHA